MALSSQQKLVRVNSKYRSAGTTSEFTMSYRNKELDGAMTVSIVRAELLRTFPNMYSPINTLSYVVDGVPGFTVTVAPGQYTAPELAAALSAATIDWTVVYNTTLHRFQFTYNGIGTLADIVPGVGMANYVGVTSLLAAPASFLATAQSPPDLSGPSEVYIESNLLASSSCVDSVDGGLFIPWVGHLSFATVEYGFVGTFVQYESKNFEINYQITQGQQTIKTFDIRLTDRFGNVLPIPDNCFLDMMLKFTYETP